MKKKKHYRSIIVISLSVVSLLWIQVANAVPGGQAKIIPFTGRLVDSTGQVVANGDYRMRVRIFDADTAGTQLYEELFDNTTDYGSGACPEQSVQNGYFRIEIGVCNTITTDAYKSLYNNTELYTEISLDFDKDGTYEEVFAPRRRLGLAPGAVSALQLVSDGTGTSSNTLSLDDQGHLQFEGVGRLGWGIGGAQPQSTMEVYEAGNASRLHLYGVGDGFTYSELRLGRDTQGSQSWNLFHRQFGGETGNFAIEEFDGANFNQRLVINPGGNVGIGTTSPQTRLQLSANNGAGVFDALRISNNAGSGQSQITFEEGTQIANFAIRYNGSADQLEFWGGASGSLTNLINFDRGNGDLTSIGGADFGGSLDVAGVTNLRNGRVLIDYSGTGGVDTPNIGNSLSIKSFAPNIFFEDKSASTANSAIHLNQDIFRIGFVTGPTTVRDDIAVTNTGRVGIRTAVPAVTFQVGVSGDGTIARANAWNTFSDQRWKKDLVEIENAVDKLSQVNGYYYKWQNPLDTSKNIGFIAQQVQQVFPEIVQEDVNGYLSLDYAKMTPVLVQAIQELNAKIDAKSPSLEVQDLVDSFQSEKVTFESLTLTGDGVVKGDLSVEGDLVVDGAVLQDVKTIYQSYQMSESDSIIYANVDRSPSETSLVVTLDNESGKTGQLVRVRFIGNNQDKIRNIVYGEEEVLEVNLNQTYEFVRTENGWLPI